MYTKAELQDLRAACDECGIPLYLDGARMGYALCAPGNDLFMEDYAELCDLFYIGGTKCGMLMGEALVICNPALQKDFRYLIKQKGGMLAKGRLLGVQFEEMFKDGLYEEACGHGIEMALKLKKGLEEKGYEFLFESGSNQQFPILTEEKRAELAKKYDFAFWERVDANRAGVRFCTSWATKESDIDALLADM
jgi:threonine aldolase